MEAVGRCSDGLFARCKESDCCCACMGGHWALHEMGVCARDCRCRVLILYWIQLFVRVCFIDGWMGKVERSIIPYSV